MSACAFLISSATAARLWSSHVQDGQLCHCAHARQPALRWVFMTGGGDGFSFCTNADVWVACSGVRGDDAPARYGCCRCVFLFLCVCVCVCVRACACVCVCLRAGGGVLSDAITSASDVWSWGMVMWEVVTGQTVFGSYKPPQISRKIWEAGDRPDLEDVKVTYVPP